MNKPRVFQSTQKNQKQASYYAVPTTNDKRRQTSHLPHTMTLATLPDDALQLIMCYVGDAVTLLNVEKTCRRLKTAVEDDTVWAVPPPIVRFVNGVPQESDYWAEDTRFASNRERACVSKNLRALRLEQMCTSNILLEELGTGGYTALAHMMYLWSFPEVKFRLREDTLETLAELVQHGIILQLQRSQKLVAYGEGNGYPTVTLTSIEQQAELADMLQCLPMSRLESYLLYTQPSGIDTRTRDRVIRRLLYRAGVPKMANNAYTFVWETILHLTEMIFLPACIQLHETQQPLWEYMAMANMTVVEMLKSLKKRKVHSWRMTRYVTPNPEMNEDEDVGGPGVVWTPVPSQLEESSARLGLANRVYSVLGDPSSIAAVQENYEVAEDIAVIEYDSDGSISRFVDHCNDDEEESDFSVYSDVTEGIMSITGDDLDEALEEAMGALAVL
jgi:hypothetical protein